MAQQNCSSCYNGCTTITSDKCVMYTGVDVPVLDIKKGDSLSFVEQALITFLTSTINGSGIKIEIDEADYCTLVSQYLQQCSTVTALDLFKALVKAACNIQGQIDTVNTTLTTLNADYNISCLSGVTSSSDTHLVVQAVITKLCEIDTELTALSLDVDTNFVKVSELNNLIAAYIASTETGTRFSSRMVPFAIQAYYGSLSFFDITGKGIAGTEWEDIYLCNGLNGTPDLRGRVPVGAIAGVPGGTLDSAVNPASSPFNPNYSLGTLSGSNSTTLIGTQIPSHSHVLTDPGHTHHIAVDAIQGGTGTITSADDYINKQNNSGTNLDYALNKSTAGPTPTLGRVEDNVTTGITIANTGGGQAHANNQPTIATYFIIYIP